MSPLPWNDVLRERINKKPIRRNDDDSIDTRLEYISKTLCYKRNRVQGFLQKEPTRTMFVMSSRIERYFLLDHGRQILLIYKTNDLNQGATSSIDYGSIISIIEPEAKAGQLMERWGYGFRLETRERWFQLFAICEDEYKLWVHTIKWILHRNQYSLLFKNGQIDNTV